MSQQPGPRVTPRTAGRLLWPSGTACASFEEALRQALDPRLDRLDGDLRALREVLEVAVPGPQDFPTRVIRFGDGRPGDFVELNAFVPGDSVEVAGRRDPAGAPVVHTYPYAEAHALALGDLLLRMEAAAADLRRLLLQEAADDRERARRALALLLVELPPEALARLADRRRPPERAERDAWLRRTRKRLRALEQVA